MPFFKSVLGFQPRFIRRVESMSFLGVPSGLVMSKMSLFLNPTTSFTVSASCWMVISLPEPMLMWAWMVPLSSSKAMSL